jgi:endonuclease/exonuclease/phosphatase family metal-dependent hydrolase
MITVAYNVYSFEGYVHQPNWARGKVGGKVSVDGAREIGEALLSYGSDIVTTSESHDEAAVAALAEAMAFEHVYFESPGLWPGGLVTRYKILEAGNCPLGHKRRADLFTRHWGRAVLEMDDGEPLIVHSVHTFAGWADVRCWEVKQMLEVMKGDLATGHSVIVQGDFNHTPYGPEYAWWLEAGLVDTFAQIHGETDDGKTLLRPQPRDRLDYVLVGGPIKNQLVEARPLYEDDFRLYKDQPDFVALSDHLPQLAKFEV